MFGFEKLDVWREAIEYVDEIYSRSEGFPMDERFGLTVQLRRAAVSIATNIAEGSGRRSRRDFLRFISMAYGSLCETISPLHICLSRKLLSEESYSGLAERGDKIGRMLSGLRESLKLSTLNPQPSTDYHE